MAATRTQIYLTTDQRKKLDEIGQRQGKTLAQLVRDAVDCYLEEVDPDIERRLAETFGSAPNLEVPSRDEWDRGYG